MTQFDFSRGAWDAHALPPTYSVACRDHVEVTQEERCISADYNEAIGDYDYIGVAMTEPTEGERTITARLSFAGAGAPLIVLADGITVDETGHRIFGPMYEIVAYAGGCNVWRILPDFDPTDPDRGYTVRSIVQEGFSVPENTPMDLIVRTEKGKLTIALGEHTFRVDTPDLPERYYVGLTLCEGYNCFYSLMVE